jgi:hypothetical protein
VFLGTPHHGSDLAKWGVFFSSLLTLAKPTNRAAVKLLRKDSEVLGDLQEDFHTLLERRKENQRNRITVVCFYETLLTCKFWVVPKDSAVIPGELSLPIHANHQVRSLGCLNPGYTTLKQCRTSQSSPRPPKRATRMSCEKSSTLWMNTHTTAGFGLLFPPST